MWCEWGNAQCWTWDMDVPSIAGFCPGWLGMRGSRKLIPTRSSKDSQRRDFIPCARCTTVQNKVRSNTGPSRDLERRFLVVNSLRESLFQVFPCTFHGSFPCSGFTPRLHAGVKPGSAEGAGMKNLTNAFKKGFLITTRG